jgi:CBS-domain-containing membrane protein
VPVVDDDGRVVGIVTDRDACMAAFTRGAHLHEIPVEVAMSRDVLTCAPDDPITLAERLMETHQVRRLPVVDHERRPVGLLAINDLASYIARPSAGQRGQLVELTRTLAAIGRPRYTNGSDGARRSSTTLSAITADESAATR